jgi:trimeric autotransporter adhesin
MDRVPWLLGQWRRYRSKPTFAALACASECKEKAMDRQEFLWRATVVCALVSTATLLAACGGGGNSGGDSDTPSAYTITGKAVDGALQGATACYDVNDNQACDTGEPTSAATTADGSFSITGIAPAEIGKHLVLVDVPASAIDADTGAAVGSSFLMAAPATDATGDHSVFVSPLSTLVLLQMATAGQSRDDAVTFVQSQLALAVSPLADFTASANADNTTAANAARLTRAAQTRQADALTAAVGQTDLSGTVVTQEQVNVLAATSVLASLEAIGAAATDGSLQGKTGADLRTALATLAAAVVAQNGPTVPEAVASIGVSKLPIEPAAPAAAPAPSGSLAALRYAGAGDWYLRSFQATAADNTPDTNGLVRYYDVRTRVDATHPSGISWVFSNDYNRAADRLWNGSTWHTCDLGFRNTSSVRDANGRSSYNFCDGFEKGTSVRRASIDITGQTLASVLTDRIRVLPGGNSGVNFADWGPSDLSLLGTAAFPEGSKLYYQTSTPLETTVGYDVRDSNVVQVFSQAIADGGDGRNGAPAPACYDANPTTAPATTLEQLIARFPGKPCISNAATNADGTSLSPNEGWGASVVSIGNVANYFAALPAGTGNYYTNEGRLRVAFTGTGNGTNYYLCYTRRTPASTRNCQLLGSGTYTITTLGDGRAMSLNNVPTPFSQLSYSRVFVEREGKVYYGYRNRLGNSVPQVRLNLPAANAMLGQLGLPLIAPAD